MATYYISPTGSDAAAGAVGTPWKTFMKSLPKLAAGDVLTVTAGTYVEQVKFPVLAAGTAQAGIQVIAAEGETPIISGLLWLKGLKYWTISGLTVAWNRVNGVSSQHMVKLVGGTHWAFSRCELKDACSFAALQVSGAPVVWSVDNCYIHDTRTTNEYGKDHLIEVIAQGSGGVIEHNLLVGAKNGRGIRIGAVSGNGAAVAGVTVRYNTIYNTITPIQLEWRTSANEILGNLLVKSGKTKAAVGVHQLKGTTNTAHDNAYFTTARAIDTAVGLTGATNTSVDPVFTGVGKLKHATAGTVATDFGHQYTPPAPPEPPEG